MKPANRPTRTVSTFTFLYNLVMSPGGKGEGGGGLGTKTDNQTLTSFGPAFKGLCVKYSFIGFTELIGSHIHLLRPDLDQYTVAYSRVILPCTSLIVWSIGGTSISNDTYTSWHSSHQPHTSFRNTQYELHLDPAHLPNRQNLMVFSHLASFTSNN